MNVSWTLSVNVWQQRERCVGLMLTSQKWCCSRFYPGGGHGRSEQPALFLPPTPRPICTSLSVTFPFCPQSPPVSPTGKKANTHLLPFPHSPANQKHKGAMERNQLWPKLLTLLLLLILFFLSHLPTDGSNFFRSRQTTEKSHNLKVVFRSILEHTATPVPQTSLQKDMEPLCTMTGLLPQGGKCAPADLFLVQHRKAE